MVASHEVGRRRVPISLLPDLTHTVGLAVEALIGESPASSSNAALRPSCNNNSNASPASPKAKQRFATHMLDTVIQQAAR